MSGCCGIGTCMGPFPAAADMLKRPYTRSEPGSPMGAVKRAAAALVAALMLLAPALWNGFPLLQYDTGGYIARWFEGTLEVSRSTVYGFFLDLTARPNFWPAVLVQVALTVWIIALV